jgi:GNAT superfamily N-acetyltransferase
MEIKRMFTLPKNRGRGLASAVLAELETWAKEMLYKTCILETGKGQPEAIKLYKKKRLPAYTKLWPVYRHLQ